MEKGGCVQRDLEISHLQAAATFWAEQYEKLNFPPSCYIHMVRITGVSNNMLQLFSLLWTGAGFGPSIIWYEL